MRGPLIANGLERLLRIRQASILYPTRVGVKALNPWFGHDPLPAMEKGPRFDADSSELLLPFDGLKDEYALVGVPVPKSPHAVAMATLEAGGTIQSTEYWKRLGRGTLDFRRPQPTGRHQARRFTVAFGERKRAAVEEGLPPVLTFAVGGKNYIADGKHRAALCSVMGIEVPCIPLIHWHVDSHLWALRDAMLRRPDEYRKNLYLLNEIVNRRGKA